MKVAFLVYHQDFRVVVHFQNNAKLFPQTTQISAEFLICVYPRDLRETKLSHY